MREAYTGVPAQCGNDVTDAEAETGVLDQRRAPLYKKDQGTHQLRSILHLMSDTEDLVRSNGHHYEVKYNEQTPLNTYIQIVIILIIVSPMLADTRNLNCACIN